MRTIDLFEENYHLKIIMYGSHEHNHQVIGMHHYQIGQKNEQNQLENINKNRKNKFCFIVLFRNIYIQIIL